MIIPAAIAALLLAPSAQDRTVEFRANGVNDSERLQGFVGTSPGTASNKTVRVSGGLMLNAPIRIPPGTRNLRIIGDGSEIRLKNWTQVFEIGRIDFSVVKAEPIPGIVGVPIETALSGATSVTTRRPISPGWHLVYDAKRVAHRQNKALSLTYAAMLVKVLAVQGSKATLDRPLNREYDTDPKIASVDGLVTENVEISGFGMDGLFDPTKGAASGLIAAGLTSGLKVSDLKARRIDNGPIKIGVSRDFTVDNVRLTEPTGNPGAPGAAYGIYILRSSHGVIRNSETSRFRHGFILHSGTTDVLVEGCKGTSAGSADFDTHGMDERRITFRKCTGATGFGLGNDAWTIGGFGHVIEDCHVNGGFYVGPNVKYATVRRSSFLAKDSQYLIGPSSNEGGRPGRIRFEDVGFQAASRILVLRGSSEVDHLEFVRCRFTVRDEFALALWSGSGKITFDECRFRLTGSSMGDMLVFDSKGKPLNVTVNNSEFVGTKQTRLATLWDGYTGTLTLSNNTFRSPVATDWVLDKTGKARITKSGNKLAKAAKP